jgi:hypothetical protein
MNGIYGNIGWLHAGHPLKDTKVILVGYSCRFSRDFESIHDRTVFIYKPQVIEHMLLNNKTVQKESI